MKKISKEEFDQRSVEEQSQYVLEILNHGDGMIYGKVQWIDGSGKKAFIDTFNERGIKEELFQDQPGNWKLMINREEGKINSHDYKSRITSTFYFKSYTSEDMREIFLRIAKLSNFELEDGVGDLVKDFFEKQVKRSDFGNGREARALLENSALFAARRLMESGKKEFKEKEMKLLTMEDVQNAVKKTEVCEVVEKEKIRKIGFV